MVKLKLPTRVQPEVLRPQGTRGNHTNKIEFMQRHLLDEIAAKPFAPDFMQPVDAEALHVPAYYMIIRDPMDVGTIISCVDELIADFRLVISNCFTFNHPGEVVYRKGMQLEKFFLKVLAQLPMGSEQCSNKDPRACHSPATSEKSSSTRKRQCREHLKKLQNGNIEQVDEDVWDFFKEKWCAVSKKISKHAFKTFEDFYLTLDIIFLQSQTQAKRVYESAFYVPLDSIPHYPRNSQLNELLYEVKRVDGSLRSPYNAQAKWEDSLMDGIDFIIDRLKKKLDTCHQLEEQQQ